MKALEGAGMIDQNSQLFAELIQPFLETSYAELPSHIAQQVEVG